MGYCAKFDYSSLNGVGAGTIPKNLAVMN